MGQSKRPWSALVGCLANGFRDFSHYRLQILLAASGNRAYRSHEPHVFRRADLVDIGSPLGCRARVVRIRVCHTYYEDLASDYEAVTCAVLEFIGVNRALARQYRRPSALQPANKAEMGPGDSISP